MDIHTATEQAYRNGYEAGKRDAEPKWIPVSEPPKEIGIYQVFLRDKEMGSTKVWYGQFTGCNWSVYDIYGDEMRCEVTHWKPIPNPPTE